MKKIATIIGARPQFIKCAPVSKQLRKSFEEIIIHTGQHYDDNMSKVFFDELKIPEPEYNLEIGSGSHGLQTGRMLIEIESLLMKIKPDLVLIYGDTNSTFAGAAAASKLHIPVAHIEAGLRSFNKNMPEELNRICADHFSEFLFCPTDTAVVNLRNEGIIRNVFNVGDVMKDAILQLICTNQFSGSINKKIIPSHPYYFFTLHRQENTDDIRRLSSILSIIGRSRLPVVFPIHPRTKRCITEAQLTIPENMIIIDPVTYKESLSLQLNSSIVITDSGGIQKEAYILKKPCITLRDQTEWIETLSGGTNILAGIDESVFREAEYRFLNNGKLIFNDELYGSGDASLKITDILMTSIKTRN